MNNFKKIITNEYFWFFFIILLGIFLRLYKLDAIPPGFTGDEGWLGLDALDILKNGWVGIYIPGHAWGYNALHAYIAVPFLKILGGTIFAVRLATVIPSIFHLIAFYFLSKQFLPTRIALLSLAFLSISHWHIHFSRMSYPAVILVPLFSTLSYLFLILAIKSRKNIFFILVGISLGLGINSYLYFNFTFIFLIIFLIAYSIINKDFLKTYFQKLLITLIVFSLFAIPYTLYVIKTPDVYTGKWGITQVISSTENQEAKNKINILKEQTLATLGIFFIKGDLDGLDNLPGLPILEKPLAFFFILGLGYCVFKYKNKYHLLLLLWFLGSLIPAILTNGAPNARRIIDSSSSLFIFIGFGFYLFKKIAPKQIFIITALIIFSYSIFAVYNSYFITFAQDYGIKGRYAYEIVKMCEYYDINKNELPYIYFYHPMTGFTYETRLFLCPNLLGENRSTEFGTYSLENYRTGTVAFAYFGHYQNILPLLRQKYPQGKSYELIENQTNFIFGLYTIKE